MQESPYGYHLPIDISTHGYRIDHIFNVMHIFMLVLFVGWLSFFLYTLYRFRKRPNHKANYAPKYTHFSSYLEVGIACFEALVLIFLAVPTWKIAKASIPTGKDRFEVRITAEQFAWNIHYPGPDGRFGKTDPSLVSSENPVGLDKTDPAAKDDLVVINTFHFPVDRTVLVYLTSKDVIHSFGVPVLRVKQDAIPGMVFPVYFQANKKGDFDIVCSQLCGLGHYRMKGTITVEGEDDFQKWFKDQKSSEGT